VSNDYVIEPDALEHDGLLFDDWSQELDRYREGIKQPLDSSDFSLLGLEVLKKYIGALAAIGAYIEQGSDVMDGFGRALLQTVKIYMEAESYSQEDVDRVTKELNEL
jgi:hypothetical protein